LYNGFFLCCPVLKTSKHAINTSNSTPSFKVSFHPINDIRDFFHLNNHVKTRKFKFPTKYSVHRNNYFFRPAINKTDLHFLQWNVRSMKSRSLDLTSRIARYHLLFLSETWLLPNSSLNNYHLFRSNCPDGYRGSAITIH
jgi:hypothetical protein